MPNQPERDLKPTPEAEAVFRRWLAHLNDEFCRHTSVDRRSEIVRDELYQIYLGPAAWRQNQRNTYKRTRDKRRCRVVRSAQHHTCGRIQHRLRC